MKKTVKEHFVPVFYLNEFVDKDGYLYVYDKEKKKYFKTRPKEFCYQKDLYETKRLNDQERLGEYIGRNDIENTFAD